MKYEVSLQKKNLTTLEKDIELYIDDIKVLRAEWSCLNDPKRLKNLCEKYLKNMKPIENSQIKSYDKFMEEEYLEHYQKSDEAFNSFIDNALGLKSSQTEG
jgi:hypothetical protein